jgi:hypothetical protein
MKWLYCVIILRSLSETYQSSQQIIKVIVDNLEVSNAIVLKLLKTEITTTSEQYLTMKILHFGYYLENTVSYNIHIVWAEKPMTGLK